MTSQRKRATLSEHADRIKAAIEAAIMDGYKVDPDVTVVYYDGHVERVEIDLWEGGNYINLLDWDYT